MLYSCICAYIYVYVILTINGKRTDQIESWVWQKLEEKNLGMSRGRNGGRK